METTFDDSIKAGFARLLKHFEDNTDDVVKITRAFALANRAHRGRSSDGLGASHPLRVALVLAEELQVRDVELVSAALLHDALEGLSEEELLQECGDRVVSIVRAVTEPKKPEEKTLDDYFARLAKEPKEARYVKLADRLDTARAMKNFAHRDRALRYKDETQKHVVPLAQGTDERFVLKLSVALYEIK
jgi:GTP pyrophosphokinase